MNVKEPGRKSYERPHLESWMLSQPLNLLTNLSSDAEFDELTDGGQW